MKISTHKYASHICMYHSKMQVFSKAQLNIYQMVRQSHNKILLKNTKSRNRLSTSIISHDSSDAMRKLVRCRDVPIYS
jgi:hypothetical protein